MNRRRPPALRSMLRGVVLALALALGLGLSACGDDGTTASDESASADATDGSDATSASPTKTGPDTSDWPRCEDAWNTNKRLPAGYRGCLDGTQPVRAKKTWCSSGQVIVTYADRFYAVLGKQVNETAGLDRSRPYKQAMGACLA